MESCLCSAYAYAVRLSILSDVRDGGPQSDDGIICMDGSSIPPSPATSQAGPKSIRADSLGLLLLSESDWGEGGVGFAEKCLIDFRGEGGCMIFLALAINSSLPVFRNSELPPAVRGIE